MLAPAAVGGHARADRTAVSWSSEPAVSTSPLKMARMDSSTRSGVIILMQTGSSQAEFFWLVAITHGEHDRSAVIDSVLPRLP